MEKLYEKKNFGIPVTILSLLAYLIGYSLTQSISGTLLVAVLFAFVVFSFDFDVKVKNAVKHSFIFATFARLILFFFDIFGALVNTFVGRISISSLSDYLYDYNFFKRFLSYFHSYGLLLVEIAIIVIFGICIIMTLADKDINIGFVATILGDKPRKQKYHQPQQPTYYQQAPNQAPPAPGVPPAPAVPPAPQMQQAVQEQAATQAPGASDNKGKFCPNCGKENISGAVFCAGCGTKI
ncbi:MAG: zinc ribbon domain-containing protein [Clostridiales bacterium]|nr:zinc ribbon domain-containing protein [Clostridiales bacterium]